MPKISEATVKAHHDKVERALVDAAESILRESGREALTSAAVSAQAGIARNSIYRYVNTVDELCAMVVQRHVPLWHHALTEALRQAGTPQEAVAIWARVNMEQASVHGHAWLMRLYGVLRERQEGEGCPVLASSYGEAGDAAERDAQHCNIEGPLLRAWQQLRPHDPQLGVELTRALVRGGMHAAQVAREQANVDDCEDKARAITQDVERAVRALAATLSEEVNNAPAL